MVYKIGSRKSLLAKTQSEQIKILLESQTTSSFEMVFITTKGDQDQHTPLWQMEINNIFTRELDHALTDKKTDLNIHSFKDLGLQRPPELTIGALTKRSFPHDILLIKNQTIKDLFNNKLPTLKIGTSSPRRTCNINRHLKNLLSYQGELSISSLRGNVNSRIEKLQNGEFDCIILAMAGLERLAMDTSAHKQLTLLLRDLNFLILPISLFPGAAAQGTLAIEIRQSDKTHLLPILAPIHDPASALEVTKEREAFAQYGGGCHLPVGIYVRKFEDGFIHCHQGLHQSLEINILKLDIVRNPPVHSPYIFIGQTGNHQTGALKDQQFIFNQLISYQTIPCTSHLNNHVVLSSDNVLNAINADRFNPTTLWTSGLRTMKTMFKRKCWVNGTGDFLGEEGLISFKNSQFINLFLKDLAWSYLTNDKSESTLGPSIPTYTRIKNILPTQYLEQIERTQIFYWMSFYQYEAYLKIFPGIATKCHCCGIGKTYKHFKERNIPAIPFINLNEFYQWLDTK